MIRALLVALSMVASSQAAALSCMAPDVTRAYAAAQEAEVRYIVVSGVLRFHTGRLPRALGNDSPPSTPIPARLTGQALTATGFDFDFDRAVTLEVLCYGPWCGGAGSDTPYLAFLREGADGYVISADPCGAWMFQDPADETLGTVARCFREGRCPAE